MGTRYFRAAEAGQGKAGAATPVFADPAWMKHIREPLLHSHGLRWSQLVLPNNLFFFSRRSVEQLRPLALSHVRHDRYEVVVCYDGAARVCLGDAIYDFEPGTAIMVRPGQFHDYFDFQRESLCWLFFSFDLDADSSLLRADNTVCRLSDEQLALISNVAQRYGSLPLRSEEIFFIARDMAAVIADLNTEGSIASIGKTEDEAFKGYDYFRRIAEYVAAHMNEAVRIEDIARELGMSDGYLRKVFRELTGTSLGRWLRNSRFGCGASLIVQSDLSISEIAQLSGFETIPAFSRAFSQMVGMSPTAYRRHINEGGTPASVSQERLNSCL